MSLDGPFSHLECMWYHFVRTYLVTLQKKKFGIEPLLFEKNEMEQKVNFNHIALTIEQLR